jgi:hypothetical protein
MPTIDEVFSAGESLKAADLPAGRIASAVIASVEPINFDDGSKLIVNFVGKEKVLITNKTNANLIAVILGTRDYSRWIGGRIGLRSELVDFRGSRVPAVRVCDAPPAPGVRVEVNEYTQAPPSPPPTYRGGHGEADPQSLSDIPF